MNSEYNADIVIIGGGIAGALMAYELAKAKADVLIIEAGDKIDRSKAIENYMNTPDRNNDTPYAPMSKSAPYPQMMTPDDYYIQTDRINFKAHTLKLLVELPGTGLELL
ncbi:MAG: FAD-dependent oxidoreductase [Ignavibacteria bacterium]